MYPMGGDIKVKAYAQAVSERRRAGQIQGHLEISRMEGELRPRLPPAVGGEVTPRPVR
jgi:hypothetical protein